MSLRPTATISGAGSAFALALMLATPAAGAALGGEMPGDAPPPAHDMPGGHDMRPMWQGGASAAGMPDARTRDAWLRECHRRTELYYDGYGDRHHRRHGDDHHDSGPGYSYCEAYFDDYYRTYAQPGYAHAYAMPMMAHVRPMAMAPAPMAQSSQPCEEVVTEEYVPARTRYIPRRPARRLVPDKRIRMAP
jgi:hypothetical protein